MVVGSAKTGVVVANDSTKKMPTKGNRNLFSIFFILSQLYYRVIIAYFSYLRNMWYDKSMKKMIGFLAGFVMMMGVLVPVGLGEKVYAMEPAPDTSCDTSLLGFKAWYNGVTGKVDKKCVVGTPTEAEMNTFVWTIVLNILFDLELFVGYAATVVIIYAGYKYITSNGDTGAVAKAKKALMSAVIGLAIALLAQLITNFILGVLVWS